MASKLLLAVTVLAMTSTGSSDLPIGGEVQFVIPDGATDGSAELRERTCNAFWIFGDCSHNPVDDFLDSATVQRHLMWSNGRYISYMAMRKNNVPCSRRGSSYYNCRPGKAVNPYHRGCSAITMCARVW